MKNSRCGLPTLVAAVALFASPQTHAQPGTSNSLPVVTIRAMDEWAAEAGGGTNNARFSVSRMGDKTNSLVVFYSIQGSASNGVDYLEVGNNVTIAAGESSAPIVITAIDDALIEPTEGVNLRLTPSPLASLPTYFIGSPSNATVYITDNDSPPPTNRAPYVQIVLPPNNVMFTGPTNILLSASARDEENGYNITVEFFEGTNSLGLGTFVPSLCPSPWCPSFMLTWSNVPPSEYTLKAKATDQQGAMTWSAPIFISVKTNASPPPPEPPIIRIEATDPRASEPGMLTAIDHSVFKVIRNGNTNNPLLVNLTVGGSASNGVDCAVISNSVVIPAGKTFASIHVVPLGDSLPEPTETVELRLVPMSCCYQIGSPNNAVVFIEDNDPTNRAPLVHITAPTNGAMFLSPVNIPVVAEASDSDGDVLKVDFFAGDRFIGRDEGTNKLQYSAIWTNVLPGAYSLRAKAFDNYGAMGISGPVAITVKGTNQPPETNFPPVVTIYASDSIGAEGTNYWLRCTNTSVGWDGTNRIATTNTATFVIRRSGPTNLSLTVNYRIAGTASNGVDYAAIPESVTIPAGERSKRITILPIDDSLVECPETVILRLLEVTNLPPDYIVGWPGRAAAIIIDNDAPPPDTKLLCDGNFHITIPATNGFTYRLEISHDLQNWLPICTNIVNDAGIYFTDPETADFLNRFYRIVGESSAPQP